MSKIYVYQIYYDDASRMILDPGYIPLDNTSNERPDWYEYHSIRTFLLANKLEEDAYYGFFSPNFRRKTNLSSLKVKNFIAENEGVDVALFCHSFDHSAFFQNVFYQGKDRHLGLLEVSQQFANDAGIEVDIKNLVTDSTNTIFSNYFVARPSFWKRWFYFAEKLYEDAESKARTGLVGTSLYGGKAVHHKVFLMERLATLLLATSDIHNVAVYAPLDIWMQSPKVPFADLAMTCDSLKLAYRRLNDRRYLETYGKLINFVSEQYRIQPNKTL